MDGQDDVALMNKSKYLEVMFHVNRGFPRGDGKESGRCLSDIDVDNKHREEKRVQEM